VSQSALLSDRQEWARGKLFVAWLNISRAVESPDVTDEALDILDGELWEAMAIATEWGVDPQLVIAEAEAKV
jgi:hypothetical protein